MNNGNGKLSKNVIGREQFLRMLDTALECQAYRFGRQAALSWLAIYPGDLEVTLLHAKMLAGDRKPDQALVILEKLVSQDPEYLDAHQFLARMVYTTDAEKFKWSASMMRVLGEEIPASIGLENWVEPLLRVRELSSQNEVNGAQEILDRLLNEGTVPLVGKLEHLRLVKKMGDAHELLQLANFYLAQQESCIELYLHKAAALLELKDETNAVQLLHQCVSMDSTGQVIRRLWGRDHPYKAIWPEKMEVLFDIPLPAEVSVRLTGAWLPEGNALIVGSEDETAGLTQPASDVANSTTSMSASAQGILDQAPTNGQEAQAGSDAMSTRDELKKIESEFRRVAKKLKQPVIGRSDGRFPVYVVFSSRQGLENQYGPQTAGIMEIEMQRLAEAVRKRTGWNGLVFIPDNAENASKYGLSAVEGMDPWKLKLALADFDKALAKKGEMIGMLLIVGGPSVVPFHELPNPADDYDEKIQSDNPYATLGSNYFVPEWPVGRLPGSAGPDAGLLLAQLRYLISFHNSAKQRKSIAEGSVLWPFLALIDSILQAAQNRRSKPNIGYTAAVWRRSSTAVFRPVGNPGNLLVSPPQDSQTLPVDKLLYPEAVYYNLHGMEDNGDWYGQRDPFTPATGPDYPVALSPAQLRRNGHAPRVIFTEACYGAHILGKSEEDAMSLKFLSLGTLALVGSSCIAYGAITTPLVAADLLGHIFWQQMKNGRSAGEALMIAKIEMSREMIKRQGFLDAEDQKTLLSFMLYGDPLIGLVANQKRSKSALRLKKHPFVKTVNEKPVESGEPSPVSFKVLEDVKQKLASYLPGIDTAEIHISTQEAEAVPNQVKAPKRAPTGKCYVVTVSKMVPFAKSIHRHYARATVAPDGKVIKLTVSR